MFFLWSIDTISHRTVYVYLLLLSVWFDYHDTFLLPL